MDKIKTDTIGAIQELEDLTEKLKIHESEVKSQAFEVKRKLEESGNDKSAEIFASARKEIEAIKEKSEMEINVKISEARKHLQEESEALAVKIMEKLLDRRLAQ